MRTGGTIAARPDALHLSPALPRPAELFNFQPRLFLLFLLLHSFRPQYPLRRLYLIDESGEDIAEGRQTAVAFLLIPIHFGEFAPDFFD
jgi:hypothetical protein